MTEKAQWEGAAKLLLLLAGWLEGNQWAKLGPARVSSPWVRGKERDRPGQAGKGGSTKNVGSGLVARPQCRYGLHNFSLARPLRVCLCCWALLAGGTKALRSARCAVVVCLRRAAVLDSPVY